MSDEFNLIAEMRDDRGKGASRRLRHQGKVPAIIYGAGREPRALMFDHNKVLRELENASFYSSILTIKVGDKSRAAIVKDIQRHPSKKQILRKFVEYRFKLRPKRLLGTALGPLQHPGAPGQKKSGKCCVVGHPRGTPGRHFLAHVPTFCQFCGCFLKTCFLMAFGTSPGWANVAPVQ